MNMRKTLIVLLMFLILGVLGCGTKTDSSTEVTSNEEGAPAITVEDADDATSKDAEPANNADDAVPEQVDDMPKSIDDETALLAVKNYCHSTNPDLQEIENEGEYPVYWEIESSDEKAIVVLFRSYTGAEVRYYVDPKTGETYVTEFVAGITDAEERTDEVFNVTDYLD